MTTVHVAIVEAKDLTMRSSIFFALSPMTEEFGNLNHVEQMAIRGVIEASARRQGMVHVTVVPVWIDAHTGQISTLAPGKWNIWIDNLFTRINFADLQDKISDTVECDVDEMYILKPRFFHPDDDVPPRCRSCGSNNIDFLIHDTTRYWICLDCGRQSGEAARYDPNKAVPAPHNDPQIQKALLHDKRIEQFSQKPTDRCPKCRLSSSLMMVTVGFTQCKFCGTMGPITLFRENSNQSTSPLKMNNSGCMTSFIIFLANTGLVLWFFI